MIFAFFRLILIALSTVLFFALIGYGLRTVGEQQEYTTTPHPLLDNGPLYVAWGGFDENHTAFSLPAYQTAADKKFILGVELRLSRDGVWYIYPDKYVDDGGFLTHKTSDELDKLHLKNSSDSLVRFSTLLTALPTANYYVVIQNPASPYLEQIFKSIEAAHLEEHFILSSPFADTTRFLRERNSLWLTGTTTSEVAKSQLLASLYLEPLVTTTGDIVLLDKVNKRLMTELRKRHLGVLLKSENFAEIKDLLQQNLISGALTSRPSQFLIQ
jgi:hypothetical protein